MSVMMSILKIILYVLPFVLAVVIGWYALYLGLTGGGSPITTANLLVVAALLLAALNVGWIVAYNMK